MGIPQGKERFVKSVAYLLAAFILVSLLFTTPRKDAACQALTVYVIRDMNDPNAINQHSNAPACGKTP